MRIRGNGSKRASGQISNFLDVQADEHACVSDQSISAWAAVFCASLRR